jgi:Arc/MetJ family transcription regulator
MRTTLEISDELLRRAKRRAADEATTLRQVVEDALRRYLTGRPARRGYELRWRTEKGRILPSVRLDDRDALSCAS